ncbi:hypothetical protein RB595_003964 [Gaeumannomyces hyphopodioides]
MPGLIGFSDNPFGTRSDLAHAGASLLRPLAPYKSAAGARIKLAAATGTSFSETAAQLEGFARPLWVVTSLLNDRLAGAEPADVGLDTWVSGLDAGTDPSSPEYWGDLRSSDQRMVEMESIAYALLVSPEALAPPPGPCRDRLVAWLRQINDRDMGHNNWRWFRVFVNLALVNVLGVPRAEVQRVVDADLALLDSFYICDGWSGDGPWCDQRKQVDYYSGSFAIQLSQLLYVRYAGDMADPERVACYRDGARAFAAGFWRYFALDGAAIPFGRSLTYRFAFAAFWSAVALADVQLAAPLDNWGTVKGLLMRHLRWWAAKPHIFNTDGTMNIGFTYGNMYISEDYSSPQSVYWCLKPFVALGIPRDHPFWTSGELPHPLDPSQTALPPTLYFLKAPRHMMCSTPEHHFLLSSGQSTKVYHKGREAKYCKFAYSSSFGFSVPVGTMLHHVGADSTLCASIDDGDSWIARFEPEDAKPTLFLLRPTNAMPAAGPEALTAMPSTWRPWWFLDLKVRTTLLPPSSDSWPGWHVRIHEVLWGGSGVSAARLGKIHFTDGGFAASAQTSHGATIYESPCGSEFPALSGNGEVSEGWWVAAGRGLVISESGASGVLDLTAEAEGRDIDEVAEPEAARGVAKLIKGHSNSNLMVPRTLIPCVQHSLDAGAGASVSRFVTAVFAVQKDAVTPQQMLAMWNRPPTVSPDSLHLLI